MAFLNVVLHDHQNQIKLQVAKVDENKKYLIAKDSQGRVIGKFPKAWVAGWWLSK
jgi:hypothetical protein